MTGLIQDFRFALRMLAKSPSFTLTATLTLALGIGIDTAMFSIVDATFLRALPYPEPDRIVSLRERNASGDDIQVAYPNFLDWRAQQSVFSALAFYRSNDSRLRTADGTEAVPTCLVSEAFFDLLGVEIGEGRRMTADDDREGAAAVAWVTETARRRLFGGDTGVVGRVVQLDGRAVTIAGVLPAGFRFHRPAEFFVPLGPQARALFVTMRDSRGNSSYALGRLRPGVSLEAAQVQLSTIAARLGRQYPASNAGVGVRVLPLREHVAGGARRQQLLLWGAATMVLLIACVNVANMLLGRALLRRREMAIRTAIGASRAQLTRQMLVESVALSLVGGLAGSVLGGWGYTFASRLVPAEVRRLAGAGFDWHVLLFALCASTITGVAFGLVPAWPSAQAAPGEALHRHRRSARAVLGYLRAGDALMVAQVAVALALAVGAGLLIRSLQRVAQVPSGLQPERVVTLRIEPPPVSEFWRDPHGFRRHFERALAAAEALPEVEAAAVATGLPFAQNTSGTTFYRGDRPVPAPGDFPSASYHTVSPGYFRTLGIPLVRGRSFDGRERLSVVPPGIEMAPENFGRIFDGVVFDGVVSRRMAERHWRGEDPIGKRFRLGTPDQQLPWVRVVGVVGSTTQFGPERGETVEFYLPLTQWPVPVPMHLAVRTRMESAGVVASVRRAVQAALPDTPIGDVRLMSERIAGSVARRRFDMGLFASFAAAALALASIGVFGVLAFAVGQRTREIGIQMALGAERRQVMLAVLTRALRFALPGVLLGLLGAWGVGRLLRNSLFGVGGTDAVTYVAGTAVSLIVALLACWIPARRAARLDPIEALRCE